MNCSCQFDTDRMAYIHVCEFHLPALERKDDGRYTLAGRAVTLEAAKLAPVKLPPRHGRTYALGSAAHVHEIAQSLDAAAGAKPMPKRRIHGGPLSGFDTLRIRRRGRR